MESLIEEVFRETKLSNEELNYIASKFEKINLKNKEFLLKADEEVNHFYFIQDGCMRTYFIDHSGKEHTLQFAVKGWWISDYIALYGKEKTKSVSYIECLKDATVFKISKKDFDKLGDELPSLNRFYIIKLESAFGAFQKRILENLTLSAKERYINFVKTYPNIEQLVKNYHIASFLGITTESLSRIRKEMANE